MSSPCPVNSILSPWARNSVPIALAVKTLHGRNLRTSRAVRGAPLSLRADTSVDAACVIYLLTLACSWAENWVNETKED